MTTRLADDVARAVHAALVLFDRELAEPDVSARAYAVWGAARAEVYRREWLELVKGWDLARRTRLDMVAAAYWCRVYASSRLRWEPVLQSVHAARCASSSTSTDASAAALELRRRV